MERYLDELTARCREIMGSSLTGVYLSGSAAQGDMARLSDIDVMAVIDKTQPHAQLMRMVAELDPERLPIPAAGLEVMVVLADTALKPPRVPNVEIGLSVFTGREPDVQVSEDYPELLIDLAVCRASGKALFGPAPVEVFGAIERRWLLDVMIGNLEWHRATILDPYHDPEGQNSVLNAARAWRFALTGALVSKTEGGRWICERVGVAPIVENALAIRKDGKRTPPEPEEIDRFLVQVIDVCRSATGA